MSSKIIPIVLLLFTILFDCSELKAQDQLERSSKEQILLTKAIITSNNLNKVNKTDLGFTEHNEHPKFWANEAFGKYVINNEITDRRSENEKHFQREDGRVDMFVSSEPINFLENGKWKTIYNSILEDNNGIYKFSNLNNTFKSYYPRNIQVGFKTVINGQELLEMRNATMYYELNGQKMDVQEIESATGVANGNKLTYTNVYGNDIDLIVTQSGGKRKLDYVIRDRAAINSNLSNAQYLVFSEEITLPHGWSAKLENGAIHLLNASGNVASLYEMPVVFDSNQNLPEKESKGTAEFDNTSDVVNAKMNSKGAIQNNEDIYISRNIAYEIELLGNKLTVLTKVELTYLLDENRVYPVIVDPTLTATHNPNSWSYSYGAPYGPPPITTSGAPAGSAITNTNVSFNALNNAYYFWGWNYYSGYCGSWHSYGLFDLTPGSPNYGTGPTAIINNCGGNTNWFNCNDPNRTWLSELISMDGYDYAAYYGFTVTVTYETVSAPTAINGTSTICAGSSTTLTASGGSASAGSTAITTQWFSGSCGGTLIGTGNSITVSPTTTTTYYVRRVGQCSTTGCASVNVNVNTNSTALTTISAPSGTVCPNMNVTLTASGGTAGTGSQITWYSGPNGTGSFLGTGSSVVVVPSSAMTVYARREGTCNTSPDQSANINLKNFIYAPNGTNASSYCTDNGGWHHFYSGDEIILSIKGDLSTAGLVTATIQNNGSYHSASGNPSVCVNGGSPGEAQFELPSSWNVDHTGSLSGNYEVRFYNDPLDRTNLITAANAWMNNNPNCVYTYKYNASNNGLFWFKSNGVTYQAPSYDDDPNMIMLSSAVDGTTYDGTNYTEFSGINGFSGGSGAIVLSPAGFLPVDWMYFEGEKFTHYNQLRWGTAEEEKALRFEIERSPNGLEFEQIGQVDAVGYSFSELHYDFNDMSPMASENYYRLKLINEDGSHEYSHVIVINNEVIEGFAIFPNPVEEVLYYKFQSTQKEKVEMEVIDLLGRVILKSKWDTDPGLNILNIQTNDLQSGNYSIRILHKDRDLERSMKFTKK